MPASHLVKIVLLALESWKKKYSDIIPPSENNHLDEAQVKKALKARYQKLGLPTLLKKSYEG